MNECSGDVELEERSYRAVEIERGREVEEGSEEMELEGEVQ
jgi:hypothetical protein